LNLRAANRYCIRLANVPTGLMDGNICAAWRVRQAGHTINNDTHDALDEDAIKTSIQIDLAQ